MSYPRQQRACRVASPGVDGRAVWCRVDASRRSSLVGEVMWRASHTKEAAAKKLCTAAALIATAAAAGYATWTFAAWTAAALLGAAVCYWGGGWLDKRGVTWQRIASELLPEGKTGQTLPPPTPPPPSSSTPVPVAEPAATPRRPLVGPDPSFTVQQGLLTAASPGGAAACSPFLPTPDVARHLAFSPPSMGGPSYADYSVAAGGRGTPSALPLPLPADATTAFRFRPSPVPRELPQKPLIQLAEESYRSILRLVNKDGDTAGSLTAEGSTLQRDMYNHLVKVEKQIGEVEKAIREAKPVSGVKMEQFLPANPLSEPFVFPEGPMLGGKPTNPAVTAELGLKELIRKISTELHQWGGDRPGSTDRKLKQVLTQRLKLERVLAIENNLPSSSHQTEFDSVGSRAKQQRANRQRFLARLSGLAGEGFQESKRELADEIVLHLFSLLLDNIHLGSRRSITVEWANPGPVLRYSHSRCPGHLHLTIESTSYARNTVYTVSHVDTDLGVNTTYFTNPSRSIYEAMYFFLLIFESKHPRKLHPTPREDQLYSQSRVGVLSRQFLLEGADMS